MTILTTRQLLALSTDQVPIGPTVDIDADVTLQDASLDAVVQLFNEDESLVGLTVITSERKTLGIIPLNSFLDYLEAQQNKNTRIRGGSIGSLAGISMSAVPFYRCDEHDPPYQRLTWDEQPACEVCRRPMKRVK